MEGDVHLEVLIFSGQSVFDVLDGEEMRRARTRANPYEMIRGVFFLNRFANISLPSPDMDCFTFSLSLSFHTSSTELHFSLLLRCRAAMKMANMDFVFDRIFTNPRDSCGVRTRFF